MKASDVSGYLMANESRFTEGNFSVPLNGKTICPHCKAYFDYAAQPETSMGAVQCPECKKSVFQGQRDVDPNRYDAVNESRVSLRGLLTHLPAAILAETVLTMIANGDYDGHPFRGNQWTDGVSYNAETKTWSMKDGGNIPEHVPYIPPAWKDVQVNMDPDGDMLVKGFDEKGRSQRLYSEGFAKRKSEEKFGRIKDLMEEHPKAVKKIEDDMQSEDKRTSEAASVMHLIAKTGVRPGSDGDTGAQVQAYGATTLEGRHVHVSGDKVSLRFTGKKGVKLDIPVEDKTAAKMLAIRKKAAGDSGKLFAVDDSQLRDYSKDRLGYKPKDFRTLKGTMTAAAEVKALKSKPKTMADYKKVVKDIAKKVAEKLGNTPTIALQSYISPHVFEEIKP